MPSDKHRLDAKIWKDRYPEMQVVAPWEVVHVNTATPRFEDPMSLTRLLAQ